MKRDMTGRSLISLIIVLCACTQSDDQNASHSFHMFEADGVSIAVTSAIPKYNVPLFTFEEVLQLRQDEERPESLMYRARTFILGDDGRYYVTDQGNSRIAVFGADGEFLHSFGRDGEGPGEFRNPMLMYVRDGEAAVFDGMLRRTSIFNCDGTFQRTITSPRSTAMTMYLWPLSDERLVQFSVNLIRDDPEEMKLQYVVTTLLADGDTLGQVESTPVGTGRNIPLPQYRTAVTAERYFDIQSLAMYYPDFGVFNYCSDKPVMYWYGLDGRLERELRIELDPELVTDEEKRGIQRALQIEIDEAEDERGIALAEARQKHAIIPDEKAYWDYVMVDDHGYYWIKRFHDYSASESVEEQYPRCRLISPEGEYLGDVEFPTQNAWISRGMMLATKEDETTGATIHIVYEMTPVVQGLKYPN